MIIFSFFLIGLLSMPACSTNRVALGITDAANAPDQAEALNPARAYLHLDELTPAIETIEAAQPLPPLSERAAKRVARARSLMSEQRFTQASRELDRALRFDPQHAMIHREMAQLHWEAGNTRRARSHAESAIAQSPDDAGAYLVLGQCAMADGEEEEEAIVAFRTALACPSIQQDPSIALRSQYYVAEALSRQGYVQASLDAYNAFERTAATSGPDIKQNQAVTLLRATGGLASVEKSELLAKLGRFHQAAIALAPAATAKDAEVATIVRYAKLLDQAGRTQQAIDTICKISQVDEPTVSLVTNMFLKLGRRDALIDQLGTFYQQEPDKAHLVLSLAGALHDAGRVQASKQTLQDYLQRYPQQVAVRERLVQLYLSQKDWVGALRQSAAGLATHPDGDALLAETANQLSQYPDAIRALLDPPMTCESAWESLLLARVSLTDKRYELARSLLDQSLKANASFAPARRLLASMLMDDYQYDQALRVVARKQDDQPESAGLEMLLGTIYERLDDHDAAEQHFKAAIQLDRTNTDAMLALSQVYVNKGKRLQAQRQLRVLLDQQPSQDRARELLGRLYISDGKPEFALTAFRYLATHASDEVQRARCQVLVDQLPQIDPITYRAQLMKLTEQYPDNVDLWLAVAETYIPEEDPEPVLQIYRHAMEADPDNEDATFGVVVTSQQMLDFETAIDLLKELLRRRPNRHTWRLALADLYWTLRDYDAALAMARPYQDSTTIRKRYLLQYRQLIVEILQETKRIDEQIELLRRWSEAPDGEVWLSLLARSYSINDRSAQAVAIREAAFDKEPADRDKLTDLVAALMVDKQFTRAQQYALDWMSEDPDSDGALALLIEVLTETEAYDDVRQLSREVLLHTFNRQYFQDRLIIALRRAERFDEAADYIDALTDETIKLIHARTHRPQPQDNAKRASRPLPFQPDEPFSLEKLERRIIQLHSLEALLYMDSKDYEKASDLLEDWLVETQYPQARFQYLVALGQCFQLWGQDRKATETLEKALQIRPRDVGFNNDVAYGWIDQGIRLEEAERMIRYAVSQSPRNRAYLDTYGWLMYKKGQFEAAKKWLDRALGRVDEADPVVLDHLGDVYWRLELTDEAIGYWTASRDALAKRDEDLPSTSELKRIAQLTNQKISSARAGGQPPVAMTALEAAGQADSVK